MDIEKKRQQYLERIQSGDAYEAFEAARAFAKRLAGRSMRKEALELLCKTAWDQFIHGDATAAQTLVKDAIAIATTDPTVKKSGGQQAAPLSPPVSTRCEEHLFDTFSLLLAQERERQREHTRAPGADAHDDELVSVYGLVAKTFTAQMSAFTKKALLFHWLGMLQEAMGAIAEATSFYIRGTAESSTNLIGMIERYIEGLEAEDVPYAIVRSILQILEFSMLKATGLAKETYEKLKEKSYDGGQFQKFINAYLAAAAIKHYGLACKAFHKHQALLANDERLLKLAQTVAILISRAKRT